MKTWENILGNEVDAYETLREIGCNLFSSQSEIVDRMKLCADELGNLDENDDYDKMARELLSDAYQEYDNSCFIGTQRVIAVQD